MAAKKQTDQPILISWIAWNNDYEKDTKDSPDPKGPNSTFHQRFYEEANYEKHLLLTSCPNNGSAEASRSNKLASYLISIFENHKVELLYMDVKDVISYQDILNKVQPLLLQYRNREIHLYISPGTPMMQVVWISVAQSGLIPNVKLLQGIEAKHSRSKQAEIREFSIEASHMARALVVHSMPPTPKTAVSTEGPYRGPTLDAIYREAERIAAFSLSEITTHIYGESGAGKEYLAQHLHKQSARKDKPFMAFNCAALSDNTLESRLFGYVKGAYTGADKASDGIFRECDGGTLFLDEIGDISPSMQQTLLRVLQEGKFHKMGSTKEEEVDVKIITATHRDLRQLCQQKQFRWDLYYRLTTTELRVPPLREWPKEEKRGLAEYLLKRRGERLEQEQIIKPYREMLAWLYAYPFPGNVRELIHIIDRWYIYREDTSKIHPRLLPDPFTQAAIQSTGSDTAVSNWKLKSVAREHAQRALTYFSGNQNRTAKALDISLNTLKKHLKLQNKP